MSAERSPADVGVPTRRGSAHLSDVILLLLLSTLWGASYSFIRVGVSTIPPLTLMAARTLIASVLLSAWMVAASIRLPATRALWSSFFVQALLNSVLPFALLAWAQQWVSASLAAILNSTSPLLAFVATGFASRHEVLTPRTGLGVLAGLAGVVLIVGSSAISGLGQQALPQLAIVAASACYAGAALYGRRFAEWPAAVPATGSLIAGCALLVPASLAFEQPWTARPSAASLLALLGLSVLSTALALVLYFRLLRTLGTIGTTAQAYLRVPIGVALGITFLGESLSTTAWMGMIFVVLGVAAMVIPAKPRASLSDQGART